MRNLLAFARRHGLRAIYFTLTSALKTRPGAAVEEAQLAVLRDVSRCWARFRHKAAWRRVLGFLAVFADHGRPHVHVLAVLPHDLSIRAVCSAWTGGFTHYEHANPADASAIADYCAAQHAPLSPSFRIRRRSFSFRAPRQKHLVLLAAGGAPTPPVRPAAARAIAGGQSSTAESAATGQRSTPSRWPQASGGRPQAGVDAAVPVVGDEVVHGCPPCGSERHLRLVGPPVPFRAPQLKENVQALSPEVALVLPHLLRQLPRERRAAVEDFVLAPLVNADLRLVRAGLQHLLATGAVQRRSVKKQPLFWATAARGLRSAKLPTLPAGLHYFRELELARASLPPSSLPSVRLLTQPSRPRINPRGFQ